MTGAKIPAKAKRRSSGRGKKKAQPENSDTGRNLDPPRGLGLESAEVKKTKAAKEKAALLKAENDVMEQELRKKKLVEQLGKDKK